VKEEAVYRKKEKFLKKAFFTCITGGKLSNCETC